MAINDTQYCTDRRTGDQIDKEEFLATIYEAFTQFWNNEDAPEVDDLEQLCESVADQYATMALYEAGPLWRDQSYLAEGLNADQIAAFVLSMSYQGFLEKDRYIEGQAELLTIMAAFRAPTVIAETKAILEEVSDV